MSAECLADAVALNPDGFKGFNGPCDPTEQACAFRLSPSGVLGRCMLTERSLQELSLQAGTVPALAMADAPRIQHEIIESAFALSGGQLSPANGYRP